MLSLNFKICLVWWHSLSLRKFEGKCSSPGSFHRGDSGMNGTETLLCWRRDQLQHILRNYINTLLTSPTIFLQLTNDYSNNHISPSLPLHPSSPETSHTLPLISPTVNQIYNSLYDTCPRCINGKGLLDQNHHISGSKQIRLYYT